MSNEIETEAMKALNLEEGDIRRQGLFGDHPIESQSLNEPTTHENFKLLEKGAEENRIRFKSDRVEPWKYAQDVVPDESRPDNVLRMFSRAQVQFMSDQTTFLHLKDLDKFVGDQHTFIYEMRAIMCLLDKGRVATIQEQVIKTYVEAIKAQGLL